MRLIVCVLAAMMAWTASASAQLAPLVTWYWQLSNTLNTSYPAKIYDIDMEDNAASVIANLKAKGHTVVCYFSAGTWEDWRSDAAQFPASVLGRTNGWPGERYLDIRSPVVRDLMSKRMDVAKSKGCDALEPDNVDLYSATTGFSITTADAVDYDKFLAAGAHSRGMLVALKNSTDVVKQMVPYFDFAIVEECFKYNECPAYSPFVAAGKAVLVAEYVKTVKTTWVCSAGSAKRYGALSGPS